MQLTHLACKTTIVFARGFHVHVCMCLSVKQLKSIHRRLKQWKHWLQLSRRSQHPAIVIGLPTDPPGPALGIDLARSGLKSQKNTVIPD